MLTGLWDHWVPSADAVSSFWKTPFKELKPGLDRLLAEIDINNFTFYTKWYSNGIKSSLPFLINDPESMNVQTDNDWGRILIDYFHDKGMTVTAVLQCYTMEKSLLPREGVLGQWNGLSEVTGINREVAIVNPCWDGYSALLKSMVEEQLDVFPGLDGFFFEFEGLGAVSAQDLQESEFVLTDDLVADDKLALWDRIGLSPSKENRWLWTDSAQQILADRLQEQLGMLENLFDARNYKGLRGVVYHALGYEVPYIHNVLPNKDWWLMPWHYWGWDFAENDSDETVCRQIEFCKEKFAEYKNDGLKLCYIGNATLPTNRSETISDMVAFCRDIDADGYLGMGNHQSHYGLRWHHADDASVSRLRNLYKDLFPKS